MANTMKNMKGNSYSKKWTKKAAMELGNDMLDWFREEDRNIYFVDFLFLKCDPTKYKGKIYANLPSYLSQLYPEFEEILKMCKRIEEAKLLSLGTTSNINHKMATFVLNAKFGYSEKKEQIVTNKNIEILNIDPLDSDE